MQNQLQSVPANAIFGSTDLTQFNLKVFPSRIIKPFLRAKRNTFSILSLLRQETTLASNFEFHQIF